MPTPDLSFIINHLGEDREQYFGAGAPPLMQSSNFAYPTVEKLRQALAAEMDSPFYTRGHNPTVAILRKKLAALEAAEECLVFGSGSAAIAAGILSSVKAGDHVVCVQKPYSWTYKLLHDWLPRFGVETSFIDGREPKNFLEATRAETVLYVLESPNSMTFEQQDIEAVAKMAREKGILTLLDNSYSTPLNQKPLALGIDMVCHSASKYLGGHSDLVAGVLCSTRERCERIFSGEYMTLGGIISPNDAWLMLRGLRTLPIRMDRVAKTTPKVAAFLESHPKVERIYYPFTASDPQYELAKTQMKQPGGQFSAIFKAQDIPAMERFCDALKYFLLACSWGGYESLAYPVCTLYDSANYNKTTLPWNMVRFYIGLEGPEVLISDLEQALEKLDTA